jgi:cholesterol transport system auxiliary component
MGSFGRIIAAVACVGLCACSPFSSRPSQQGSSIYTLDETGKIPRAEKPLCNAVAVDVLGAAPGYGSSRMIYSRNPHQLESFAYHKWADTPASMLQGLLMNALEKSGRFSAVLPRSASQPVRLDAQLLQLNQQFRGGDSRLVLQVRAQLRANDEVVAGRVFETTEEAGDNPETGVAAANRAAAKFTEELVAWLDENLPKAKGACQ